MGGIGEKHLKQIWHVYLVLIYLGLRWKRFQNNYLKAAKNRRLNQKMREIRKRKATKLTPKKFPFQNMQWKWILERQEPVDAICLLSLHFEILVTKK